MPYIKQERRDLYDTQLNKILDIFGGVFEEDVDSDMAYIIYKLMKQQYATSGFWYIKSRALKVLEDVKLEYYRRVIAPYSDIKIEKNGDV